MKEKTFPAITQSINALTDFINEELEALDCPIKVQMQIDVAIDEVFSNIANYSGTTGEVTVALDYDPSLRMISLIFRDSGIPFDPTATEDPDVSAPLQERSIGGLGIYVVKKTMDHVSYSYENNMNFLTIQKSI